MADMELGGGLDDVMEAEEEHESASKVVDFNKKKPFYDWEVGGETYRMKLTTAMVCKVEDKLHTNLISVVTDGNIPTLNVMLTIAQAAIMPWRHGFSFSDMQKLFDKYVDEGGNQLSFFSDVIMGVMGVSGFFTPSQTKTIEDQNLTEEMDMQL